MPYGTVNADLMTTSDGVSSSGLYGFKNRIINGAMVISQRGTSFSSPTSGAYTIDRWYVRTQNSSVVSTITQSSTTPAGFVNSLYISIGTGSASASGDRAALYQGIEGYNTADFGWGTANAKTVTLSFWVRSSKTGQFGGAFQNDAGNRAYPFSYTINAVDTWEQKAITIAGDTTGTWLTTNGAGIQLTFDLGMGSTFLATAGAWTAGDYRGATGDTSIVSTTGATFYITGVQLEKGSTATSFDYRPYGTELQLCQRYYWKIKAPSTSGGVRNMFGIGASYDSSEAITILQFPVTMRTDPTSLEQTGTAGDYSVISGSSVLTCTSVPTFNSANANSASFSLYSSGNLTAGGRAIVGRSLSTNAYLAWSAEL
jgi:hypothetical protein